MLGRLCLCLFTPLTVVCALEVLISPSTEGGLKGAVASASAGDLLILSSGRYVGADNRGVVVDKPLTIRGSGASAVMIDCEYQGRCLSIQRNGGGTRLEGLSFLHGGFSRTRAVVPEGASVLRASQGSGDRKPQSLREHTRPIADTAVNHGEGAQTTRLAHVQRSPHEDLNQTNLVFQTLVATDAEVAYNAVLQWLVHSNVQSSLISSLEANKLAIQRRSGTRDECGLQIEEDFVGCSGVRQISARCGALTEGSVTSYPNGANCEWVIRPPGVKSIKVTFSMLSIEKDASCRWDFLKLFESETSPLGRYCSDHFSFGTSQAEREFQCPEDSGCIDIAQPFVAQVPFVLQFQSDAWSNADGFYLEWEVEEYLEAGELDDSTQLLNGGCILVESASVTIAGVVVHDCRAIHGAGLALIDSVARITASTLDSNRGQFGGGLYMQGSHVELVATTFSNNTAEYLPTVCVKRDYLTGGGAICSNSSQASIVDSVFHANRAVAYCLGLYNLGGGAVLATGTNLSLRSSTMSENEVSGQESAVLGLGGALLAEGSGVSIVGSNFVNNSAVCSIFSNCFTFGGGVHTRHGATVQIHSSLFQGNRGAGSDSHGGAASFDGCTVLISKSTFIHNDLRAAQITDGGGLFGIHSNLTVKDSFVASNNLFSNIRASGAGIMMRQGLLLLSGLRISANLIFAGVADGGGVSCDSVQVVVANSSFLANVVQPPSHFRENGFAAACRGAGLNVKSSNLTVRGSLFVSNHISSTKDGDGAGLWAEKSRCSVSESQFSGNSIKTIAQLRGQTFGGGIWWAGTQDSQVTFTLIDSEVRFNSVTAFSCVFEMVATKRACQTRGGGGGAHLENGPIVISGVSFSHNLVNVSHSEEFAGIGSAVSGDGGGLNVVRSNSSIVESTFFFNRAISIATVSKMQGGGMAFLEEHTSISACVLDSNFIQSSALIFGAGGYFQDSILTASNFTVAHNHGEGHGYAVGGALALRYFTSLKVVLYNFRVFGNSLNAGFIFSGAGIFCQSVNLTLRSGVVQNNRGTAVHGAEGAGLYSKDSHVIISNSHVMSNYGKSFGQGRGGGVWFGGWTTLETPPPAHRYGLVIANCSFYRNQLVLINNHSTIRSSPVSFLSSGGAMFVQGHCPVHVSGSQFDHNVMVSPSSLGGAIAMTMFVRMFIYASSLSHNIVRGRICYGAGISSSFSILSIELCQISNNTASGLGISEGGGLHAESSQLEITKSQIAQNFAQGAGAGVFVERSSCFVEHVSISENVASGLGGALVVVGDSMAAIKASTLHLNRGLLASVFFTEGAGLTFVVSNTSVHVAMGSFPVIAEGALNITHGNEWSTPASGHAFRTTTTSSSQLLQFVPCAPGSYMLHKATSSSKGDCLDCPFGATCKGSDRVFVLRNHWGSVEDGVLHVNRCPAGYCCSQAECFPYNFCRSNRAGLLCGSCLPGYSEAVGASGCRPDSECTNATWIAFVLFILASLLVGGTFLFQRRKMSSYLRDHSPWDNVPSLGDFKVIIFFYQILPLVMTAHDFEQRSEVSRVLSNVMSLQFLGSISESESGEGFVGFCPYVGFGAVVKISAGYLFPLTCVVSLALLVVLTRARRSPFITRFFPRAPDSANLGYGAHAATTFSLFGLAYSSCAKTTFDLLSCSTIQNELRIFRAAETRCYTAWQALVGLIVVPLLCFYPVALVLIVRRALRQKKAGIRPPVVEQCIFRSISAPYNVKNDLSAKWEASLMAQRLVMTLIVVFVTDPLWSMFGLMFVLIPILWFHSRQKPFSTPYANDLMVLGYILCTLHAGWNIAITVFLDYGIGVPTSFLQPTTALGVTAQWTPLVMFISVQIIHRLCARLHKRNPLGSWLKTKSGTKLKRAAEKIQLEVDCGPRCVGCAPETAVWDDIIDSANRDQDDVAYC